MPVFSVVICTYNRADRVTRAIESVLDETLTITSSSGGRRFRGTTPARWLGHRRAVLLATSVDPTSHDR
jgi:hypothetical protein